MLERLMGWLTGPNDGMQGKTSPSSGAYPADPPPQGKPGQSVIPSFLRTAKPNPKQILARTDRGLAGKDITTYRTAGDTRQVLKDFRRVSPDLSAAITAYVRVGIPEKHTAVARNWDGTVNPEATTALAQMIARLNYLNDYTIGYDDSPALRTTSETLAGELIMGGMCAAELVLDKLRLPNKFQPVSGMQLRWYPTPDSKRMVPKQYLGGVEVDLNIPTFFTVWLDPDLTEPYPISPIESAIQGVLFSAEFMNDMRRIVKKAIHPRVTVTIDTDKFRKLIPPDKTSPEDIKAFMDATLTDVQARVSGLAPEDALVLFDIFGVDVVDHGNTNYSNEVKVVQELADAKLAAGAKVLPTILGHSDGTANTASAETLLFLKSVEGTIWGKLNEFYSKAFTLGVRLMGHDVYVEFRYATIDLRPDSELEAFRAMEQSRILEQLSLGLVSDEEACIKLTGHLPPAGFVPLSGTNFYVKSAVPVGNGFNGASNSGSTLNQATTSDAPKNVKSQNGGRPGTKAEVVPLRAEL